MLLVFLISLAHSNIQRKISAVCDKITILMRTVLCMLLSIDFTSLWTLTEIYTRTQIWFSPLQDIHKICEIVHYFVITAGWLLCIHLSSVIGGGSKVVTSSESYRPWIVEGIAQQDLTNFWAVKHDAVAHCWALVTSMNIAMAAITVYIYQWHA